MESEKVAITSDEVAHGIAPILNIWRSGSGELLGASLEQWGLLLSYGAAGKYEHNDGCSCVSILVHYPSPSSPEEVLS